MRYVFVVVLFVVYFTAINLQLLFRVFNLLVETFNHAFASTQFNQATPSELPGALLLSSANSGNENTGFSSPDIIANIEDTALNAVAHVVGSNLELGISRLIDTSWTGEPKLRRWILEAICRVLSQKSSGNANTLSEVNAQQCELLKLITIISDEGSLPLVNALINALPNDNVVSTIHNIIMKCFFIGSTQPCFSYCI